MEDQEKRYIKRRKRKAFITNLCYRMLWILPVHSKKIVFTTFEGDGGFCCNPRYIAEELLRRPEEYEMIWLVNNPKRNFPDGIRKVTNTFWNRAYHLATAKVWVDNSRKPYGTAKRKHQLYIQTWHAALEFKPVGKFRGELFPKIAYLISEYDSKQADYVTSNSEWCTKLYPEMLLYDGKIIKTGSPRCDVLVNDRCRLYRSIREKYQIPQEAKIVMFAPTFRGGSQKGARSVFAEESSLDFEGLVKALEKRFDGKWYVFLRLHPQLAAKLENMKLKKKAANMIDVSQADDMSEVMAAADVFITDYSSSAFDAINIHMPVFLYADDLQDYMGERGHLMWDMHSLPFTVAETNEKLQHDIMDFDVEQYKTDVDAFLKEHGVLEDGKASARVADLIEKMIT